MRPHMTGEKMSLFYDSVPPPSSSSPGKKKKNPVMRARAHTVFPQFVRGGKTDDFLC